MRHSDWAIFFGLGLALIVASAIAMIAGLPLGPSVEIEPGAHRLVNTMNSVTAFALPGAGVAIALSEARRVRGLTYFIAASWAIALSGFWSLNDQADALALVKLIVMGTAAAYVYWRLAGKFAGRFAAKIAAAGDGSLTGDQSMRRCRVCTALVIAVAGITALVYARIFVRNMQAALAADALWLWWYLVLAFLFGLIAGLLIWKFCAKPHLQAQHARHLQNHARQSDGFEPSR